MLHSQSPPLAENEWQVVNETSSANTVRDRGARPESRFARLPMQELIQPFPPASNRRSIGRRIIRALTGFSIAVLIGVGATLCWQSFGYAAREMLVARAPTLAWLLSVSGTKSPAVAVSSPGPMLQLEPLLSNLDAVRRRIEQLSAKQEQVAQDIAALQAINEDIRQKMSFGSSSPGLAQSAVPIPQPKPPQTRAPSPAGQTSSLPRPAPPAGPISLSR